MAPITLNSVEALRAAVGQEVGLSDWRTVDQATINAFADATGDHQWIHVDPERAAASPFGSTIAHGLFTLSIGPSLLYELLPLEKVEGIAFGLNYGYERVRFPAPLPVGSRVRMRLTVGAVDDVAGGLQLRLDQVFEAEGVDKPACIAQQLTRLVLQGG
jgi:acyl dehydratase